MGLKTRADPPYTEFLRGETAVGGMYPLGPDAPDVAPNWMVYFRTEDCDAAASRARSGNGEVLVGPRDLPGVGRFAVLQDPQGAAFSVIALA